jgi:hypothetical protein
MCSIYIVITLLKYVKECVNYIFWDTLGIILNIELN